MIMKKTLYPSDTTMSLQKATWSNELGLNMLSPQKFAWSKILLPFCMMSCFLIFASTGLIDTGLNGTETIVMSSEQIGRIITGTAIFGLASIILIIGVRFLLKNLTLPETTPFEFYGYPHL